MELYYAPTSPFARKVRIAAHELGLTARIVLRRVDPWTDAGLRALNPLAKVPTLVTDEGGVLYESAVICDWLDSLGPIRRLIPAEGAARWRALLLQGLADGACTAAGRLFADERRPAGQQVPAMIARFHEARDAALDRLEITALADEAWTIGEIAVAALLGYLDFRWPERDWRAHRPSLAAWWLAMRGRPSLIETAHSVA